MTTDNEHVTLEPCPFCGGRAEARLVFDGWAIECQSCFMQSAFDMTETKSSKAWNRRALATSAPAAGPTSDVDAAWAALDAAPSHAGRAEQEQPDKLVFAVQCELEGLRFLRYAIEGGDPKDQLLARIETADRLLREALASHPARSPAQAGEVVAYRFRHSQQESWYYDRHPKSWWECQPLYTTPQPAQPSEQEAARADWEKIEEAIGFAPHDVRDAARLAVYALSAPPLAEQREDAPTVWWTGKGGGADDYRDHRTKWHTIPLFTRPASEAEFYRASRQSAIAPRASHRNGGLMTADTLPPLSPLPTAREKWMANYVIRMVEHGVNAEDAWALCHAGENDHDYDSDPAEAADDEMIYWVDDGDAA